MVEQFLQASTKLGGESLRPASVDQPDANQVQ
jgi:hypothetical protein